MALLTIALGACKKQQSSSCYDEALRQKHQYDFCTADCPGVTGCDGKTYCNECVMRSQGITRTQ